LAELSSSAGAVSKVPLVRTRNPGIAVWRSVVLVDSGTSTALLNPASLETPNTR
jgi:hypothetical protein